MTNLKKNIFALRFTSNSAKLHQKHIKCSKQLSVTMLWGENRPFEFSKFKYGKTFGAGYEHSGCPFTSHTDKTQSL
jgi:hypothetical protein